MDRIKLRRSVLCVPAVNRRALAKTATLDCDAVIFDLEDAVARERKAEARENLEQLFINNRPQGKLTAIRINPLSTDFGREDMKVAMACQPDAILLPKVETVANVAAASAILNANGAPLRVKLWGMIETPEGVLNAHAIAGAFSVASGGRLETLVIGVNDLRSETGVLPQFGRPYLVPWLMQVLLAGRAFGLSVVDGVFNNYTNQDAFVAECIQGNEMGFDGKMLIHPSQIAGANQHFSPSPAALAEAHAIIAAFAAPKAQGQAVLEFNGRMIERLHLEQAEALVAVAEGIEKPEGDSL
ncbi:CoA ester lyase [Martelella alba]|uniref:CoA ester lyase n=1 Tax=Martelella alba TaxID=2590451 RepID=A0A506UGJ6_9HYPH|nr:CoA ester lyase [Martelella alba]TPW32424.1 CoA ester lyase [Martelella alba]